jgi:hypothetical protein
MTDGASSTPRGLNERQGPADRDLVALPPDPHKCTAIWGRPRERLRRGLRCIIAIELCETGIARVVAVGRPQRRAGETVSFRRRYRA